MTDSTQKDVLDAMKTAIDGLSLTSMEECALRTHPTDGDQICPGITLSAVEERAFAGTNETEHWGIGVLVTMAINNDNDLDEADIIGLWRQNIRRKFAHKRLSGVTACCTCLVEPGPIHKRENNMDIDSLIVRVIIEETRL